MHAVIGAAAESWLLTSWSNVGWIMLSGLLMLLIVVAFIRLTGLRSLAKMSSFDFAVTVASLLAVQWAIAQLRRRSFGSRLVDNTPLLLVRDGQFVEEALTTARVTRSDVYAKLRQSNVHRMDEVIAVVLETTGDVSVIHGDGPLDAELYDNVRQFRPDGPLTPDQR